MKREAYISRVKAANDRHKAASGEGEFVLWGLMSGVTLFGFWLARCSALLVAALIGAHAAGLPVWYGLGIWAMLLATAGRMWSIRRRPVVARACELAADIAEEQAIAANDAMNVKRVAAGLDPRPPRFQGVATAIPIVGPEGEA